MHSFHLLVIKLMLQQLDRMLNLLGHQLEHATCQLALLYILYL